MERSYRWSLTWSRYCHCGCGHWHSRPDEVGGYSSWCLVRYGYHRYSLRFVGHSFSWNLSVEHTYRWSLIWSKYCHYSSGHWRSRPDEVGGYSSWCLTWYSYHRHSLRFVGQSSSWNHNMVRGLLLEADTITVVENTGTAGPIKWEDTPAGASSDMVTTDTVSGLLGTASAGISTWCMVTVGLSLEADTVTVFEDMDAASTMSSENTQGGISPGLATKGTVWGLLGTASDGISKLCMVADDLLLLAGNWGWRHWEPFYLPYHEPPLVVEWQRHTYSFLQDIKPLWHRWKWTSWLAGKGDSWPWHRSSGGCLPCRFETTGQLHPAAGSNRVGCSCTWQRSLFRKTHTLGPLKKFQQLTKAEEVVITRLRIGHTKATKSHILSRGLLTACHHCGQTLTIDHMLLECAVLQEMLW